MNSRAEMEKNMQAAKDEAISKVSWYATKLGLVGFAAGGVAQYALTKTKLKPFMGVSVRSSIPIMAGMFVFSVVYEQGVNDAFLHPENWDLQHQFKPAGFENEYNREVTQHRTEDGDARFDLHPVPKKYKPLPWYKETMNYANDHPVSVAGLLGVPLVGTIIYKNMQVPHLSFLQKVFHSRVVAQSGVLSILAVLLGVKSFMNAQGGRFVAEEDK